MDENKERAKGKLDEVVGSVKGKVGDWTDNEQLQAEGKAQELKGEGQQEAAKALGRVKGAGEELKGNLKQGLGNLVDNEQLQAEGKVDELKGETRQDVNQ